MVFPASMPAMGPAGGVLSAQAAVDPESATVSWPTGAELDPVVVYEGSPLLHARVVRGAATSPSPPVHPPPLGHRSNPAGRLLVRAPLSDVRSLSTALSQAAPLSPLVAVVILDVADGQIQGVSSIANPDKLRHLGPVADLGALLRKQS